MTTPAVQSAQKLRRVAAALAAGRMPAKDDAEWMAAALNEYLEGFSCGAELTTCLGLDVMPGELSWRAAEAIETRDTALREMAKHFWPDRRPAVQAYEIEKAARRYGATGWRFEEHTPDMPAHYSGTAKECLWIAYKSGADMPLEKRQLQRILGANRCGQATRK